MPIYEYRCEACGADFELLIRSKRDERSAKCPQCDKAKVARKLSVFAAHSAPATSLRPGPCGSCSSPDGSCPMMD